MKDLELEYYLDIHDKVAVADAVRRRVKAEWRQCVMVGDDLPDVALMKKWGGRSRSPTPTIRWKKFAQASRVARAGCGASAKSW
jgi:3-deoxy-D-manno-octulosonate 8-phosphate phosphatase KdsC-like HAD superfamily phosphatase